MDVQLLKKLNSYKRLTEDKKTLCNLVGVSENELNELLKELNRVNQRRCRLRRYIKLILNRSVESYFITFDFADSCLNKFKQDSRYQKVKRTLNEVIKQYGGYYIANIDFSEKGREHYHCILSLRKHVKYTELHDLMYNKCKYQKYGCIDIMGVWSDNEKRLARYLDKLTNHAFKNTTKVIYSRGMKTLDNFEKIRFHYTDVRNQFANSLQYENWTVEEFMEYLEN